jgi:hypothetical protein
VGIDVASVVVGTLVAVVIATIWLLLRTGLGRDDAGGGDAVVALSLVAAVVPAWTVYAGAMAWRRGSTPGQRRLGVVVQSRGSGEALAGASWRRGVRLAMHPLSLPGWSWLALTALLTGVPWLWVPFGLAAAVVALAGLASLVLLLVRPALPALHDRVARTSLTALPRQAEGP